ncbi:response regulator transcription factor [Streptomyces sp. GC420]|uniref:response regulator n=1 Tax=Streptomyces sp. GC420 TaxID=2697568 RepID=UPI0028BD7ADC|nr:response regulator transcription factor [Streptomyces sp. GC420]
MRPVAVRAHQRTAELPDVEVVEQAADGPSAVEAVERLRPDVVLMDLRMPGMSGLEATARITASHPGVAVVVLTMDEDDDSVFAALRAGARGYLLKESDGDVTTCTARCWVWRAGRRSSGHGSRSGCWPSSPALRPGPCRRPCRSRS